MSRPCRDWDQWLQVEHPVTEWISGVNIPSCQLMIGMGVPLHRLPDIRRLFGKDPWGTTTIDFDKDPQIPPSGAAVCPHILSPRNCYKGFVCLTAACRACPALRPAVPSSRLDP